jgi:hypothetical protein
MFELHWQTSQCVWGIAKLFIFSMMRRDIMVLLARKIGRRRRCLSVQLNLKRSLVKIRTNLKLKRRTL